MHRQTEMTLELRVGGHYRLIRQIGAGSFGAIFFGVHVQTGEEVAIKLEPVRAKSPQLIAEAKFYKLLVGVAGIARVHWYGVEGDYNAMVMDLMGPSLEEEFKYCKKKFSVKTCLMLGDQMITRLEKVHANKIVHRDIKPDNFTLGLGRKNTVVHLIDFGLAKRFRDPMTNAHIRYREETSFAGTARYASLNAQLGVEQSRRDDLEAVGYVLMYFNRGFLPWQGLKVKDQIQKNSAILEKKRSTTIEEVCKHFPEQFASYLNYCRALRFDEKPDYEYLRKLFNQCFKQHGYAQDFAYDWVIYEAHEKYEREKARAARIDTRLRRQASPGSAGDTSSLASPRRVSAAVSAKRNSATASAAVGGIFGRAVENAGGAFWSGEGQGSTSFDSSSGAPELPRTTSASSHAEIAPDVPQDEETPSSN